MRQQCELTLEGLKWTCVLIGLADSLESLKDRTVGKCQHQPQCSSQEVPLPPEGKSIDVMQLFDYY